MTRYELLVSCKEKLKIVIDRTAGEMQDMWKGKLAEIEIKLDTISIREAMEVVR